MTDRIKALEIMLDTVDAQYRHHRDRGDVHFAEALSDLVEELAEQHLEALSGRFYWADRLGDMAELDELLRDEPACTAPGGEC